jgi:hypothetical protein
MWPPSSQTEVPITAENPNLLALLLFHLTEVDQFLVRLRIDLPFENEKIGEQTSTIQIHYFYLKS